MTKPNILVTSAAEGQQRSYSQELKSTAIMVSNEIKMHYASPGLYERIVQGLEAIGKSPASVDLDDLAALDEFHLRGRPSAGRFSTGTTSPGHSGLPPARGAAHPSGAH